MATLTITFDDQLITDNMWLEITKLTGLKMSYDGENEENHQCVKHINGDDDKPKEEPVGEVVESKELRCIDDVINEIKMEVNKLGSDEEKYSFLMESDSNLRVFFDDKQNEVLTESFDIDEVKPSYQKKYREYKGIVGRRSWEDVYSGKEEEIMEFFLYELMPDHDYSKRTKKVNKMVTIYPNKAAFKAAGFVHFS